MDPSTSSHASQSTSSGLSLQLESSPVSAQLPHSADNIVEEVKNVKVDDAVAAEQQTRRARTLSSSDPSPHRSSSPSTNVSSKTQPQDQENTKGQTKENESDDSNDSAVETRRFTRRFIQNVITTYEHDAECAGNLAVTAKKFGIHRKQLEKWLLAQQSDKADADHTTETEPTPVTKEPSLTSTKESIPSHSEVGETSIKGPRREPRKRSKSIGKPDASRRKQVKDSKPDHLEEPRVDDNNCDLDSRTEPEELGEEAYDLSKMSSSSMALSLNLSMNSNSQAQSAARANSLHPNNAAMSSFALNNNPYLTSSLLRLFPNANPFNYSHSHGLPPNSNGGGLNKSSYSDRDRPSSDSPTNLSTASGGDSSQRTTPNNYSFGQSNNTSSNPLDIVDEIAYLYPHEDYTLLRQALIRNEVTLTKLRKSSSEPARGTSKMSDNPTNLTLHGNRKASLSPKSVTSAACGLPQGLSMDLIRQQQSEYLKLLQQSGFPLSFPTNLGSDMPHPGFGGATSDPSSYPPWFHSLATATALGLVGNPAAEQSSGPASKNSRNKKPANSTPTFATPKLPSSASSTLNSKPKTVAAALAASRTSPSNYRNASANSPYSDYNFKNKFDKLSPRKRQRSKLPNMASRKSYSADDDFVDPTSMLEVVTTPAAGAEYSADSFAKDMPSSQGAAVAASSMNPIHFLNQLLLQSPGNKNLFPDLSMGKQLDDIAKAKPIFDTNGNGNGLDGGIGINQQDSYKSASDLSSSSDATKNMVLHAFLHDSEVSGDARALARKFGLSGRVVMKWIKESSSRESRQFAMNGMGNHGSPENSHASPPKLSTRINGNGGGRSSTSPPTNGDLNTATMAKFMNNFEAASMNNRYNTPPVNGGNAGLGLDTTNNNETDSYLLPNASAKNFHKSNNLNITSSSVNKRKNSKPNQICDLEEDDSHSFIDEPVDMMMPNKRPHLSHAQQDA